VRFSWGTFIFRGIITSIEETLDYFAEDGTPLRATVTLGLEMNEVEREANRSSSGGAGAGGGAGIGAAAGIAASAGVSAGIGLSAGASVGASAGISAGVSAGVAVGTSPLTFAQEGESLQSLAGRAGVDWKAAAAANNIENPRQLQAGAVLNLNASAKTSS
jgi:LysM repeat protein